MKKHDATQPKSIAQDSSGRFDSSLDGHYLASRSLKARKVSSLLLSGSFGANAFLYAAFLGYVMGLWALLVQLAWVASFYLLSVFGKKVYGATSLHDFLGSQFGQATRRVAALCSIVGITYFVGWEIAIATSSLDSVSSASGLVPGSVLALVFGAAIVLTIMYSSLWGRKASAAVNVVLNAIKVLCLVLLLGLIWVSLGVQNQVSVKTVLPPLGTAIMSLGVVGLITNIIFNLSWQFVDNSSWQSISSSDPGQASSPARTIRHAGLATILTVNGIGTVIGALLRYSTDIDSSNIIGSIVSAAGQFQVIAFVAVIVLIILSAVSLFDSAILSISQSLIIDLGVKQQSKKVTLRYARIVTVLVGIVAAWGVNMIIGALGGSIFDFVYVLIVVQLSLIGPVLIGLFGRRKVSRAWLAIVGSLAAGTGAIIAGIVGAYPDLLQSAGTITTIVSIILALLLSRKSI